MNKETVVKILKLPLPNNILKKIFHIDAATKKKKSRSFQVSSNTLHIFMHVPRIL